MKPFFRSEPFFRSYRFLPHAFINGVAGAISRAELPKPMVDAAVRAWIERGGIDMSDCEQREYRTIDEFFLRRLRPGARPLGEGFTSPVDGRLVEAGTIHAKRPLRIKGQILSLDRVLNGGVHDLKTGELDGGDFATVFLSPEGYHRVHAPEDLEILDVRWIPGRYFPQNEDALRHIHAIYERNERAVLRVRLARGPELYLVLVGASLVGGIHLEGIGREDWVRKGPATIGRRVAKGEEIAHFAFGSTVVVFAPPGAVGARKIEVGARLQMGNTLWAAP